MVNWLVKTVNVLAEFKLELLRNESKRLMFLTFTKLTQMQVKNALYVVTKLHKRWRRNKEQLHASVNVRAVADSIC